MKHQIISYLQFLFTSTNAHGVHSPFVYDLVTNCFYDNKPHPAYDVLKRYNSYLKKNQSIIEVTDFGAGSRVFKSNHRRVSSIAKTAGTPLKRQKLLVRLAQYFQPKQTLELGTSLGMATAALALGNPQGTIISVEGCANTAQVASEALRHVKLNNVSLKNQSFESFFSERQEMSYLIDLAFVDGNHDKAKTLEYFEELLTMTSENSILIFDDIFWSKPMTEAWLEIKKHPKVTVSIDMYYWGMVFFRKTQPKQHFRIRV